MELVCIGSLSSLPFHNQYSSRLNRDRFKLRSCACARAYARACEVKSLLRPKFILLEFLYLFFQIGCTAVHLCSKSADLSSLTLLLENGAKTDVYDNVSIIILGK